MSEPELISTGTCFGVGVGPGDPELVTLKAARLVKDSPVVAYFAASGRPSNARRVVEQLISADQTELHFVYPVTIEDVPVGTSYEELLTAFYDRCAESTAHHLDRGRDVAVLCEGDPLVHGSFMYIHNRLSGRYATKVVPGVPSMAAAASVLGKPLVCQTDVLSILAGTMDEAELATRLSSVDAAVIMKVGRRLDAVTRAVTAAGLIDRAWYVERATMAGETVAPLADLGDVSAPYFSMVVIPSKSAGAR